MNKTKQYLLYAFMAIILAAFFGALTIWNAPKASVKSTPADFTLSATELFQEYSENQSIADKKFINHVIEVKGDIFEISKDQQGATVFLLTTGEQEAGVLCTMELGETQKISGKKVGDKITIKGRRLKSVCFKSFINSPLLKYCLFTHQNIFPKAPNIKP